MSFKTKVKRPEGWNKPTVDCQTPIKNGEVEILVEQSHKAEVDINNIIKKHGVDIIAQIEKLNTPEYYFDATTGNDFQEAMLIVAKANESFMRLPAKVRDEFRNEPARYLDYIQDPNNKDELVKRGWMKPPEQPPAPIAVTITNPPPVEQVPETTPPTL